MSEPNRLAISVAFWLSAVDTQASSLAGSGVSKGMVSPGSARRVYFTPVVARSCSSAFATTRLAAITAAAVLSRAARAICTSVTAIRPTSKRRSACSSCRVTDCRALTWAARVSLAASTAKYSCATREI